MVEENSKKEADKWVFVAFCIIFAIIQALLFGWFIVARRRGVNQLIKEEKAFIKNFQQMPKLQRKKS